MPRTAGLLVVLTAAAPLLHAAQEILFLKNGRQIVVDRYWEEGDQIYYEKNKSTFGFPKHLLERVEGSEKKPEGGSSEAATAGFRNAVVSESVEAARESSRAGDLDGAVHYYRRALESEPHSVEVRVELATLYIERGDLYGAQMELEQAKRIASEDPRVRELLGDAYYGMQRLPLAIREWQAALSIAPDSGLLYKLKKALRENDQDIVFDEVSRNPHFLIRYEGQVNEAIGQIVASALETEYYDLGRELHFTPRSAVKVTLYTSEEFRDGTDAPAWASGLNDGEIKIPVEGLTEMTPRLRRLLRHELTHSFVNAMTSGNCPSWFHEGLAQRREGSDRPDPYPAVRAAEADGTLLPLWTLEGALLGYSKEKARLAYSEALAVTEYLEARRGSDGLVQILKLLGEGQKMNDALKQVIGLDYQELQTAWEADLERYPRAR